MRALILAGGKATRLRPLTERLPKAMTPVLGRPFLEHVLVWLAEHNVRDVSLLLGFLAEPIQAHFGDGSRWGVRLDYHLEETPLGSGGAVKQLEAELTEPFFVLNGDVFTKVDLTAMQAAHARMGAEVSMYLSPVEDPSPYGVAVLDEGGWIRRFVEKPKREEAPSNLINAGVWLFQPETLRRLPAGEFCMVEQMLFPVLATEGRLAGYSAPDYWMDAGTPERYLQLQRDLLFGETEAELPRGVRVLDLVVFGDNVDLARDATLTGPLTIGDSCRIGAGAVIEDSILWPRCVIGEGATVRGSVLASGCRIGPGAVIEDCILGEGVEVRPGVHMNGVSAEPEKVFG